MDAEQYERLQSTSGMDSVVRASQFDEGTLLYGYDVDRATVHVYKLDNKIHVLKHNLDEFLSHKSYTFVEPHLLIPSKRCYLNRTSYTFADELLTTHSIELSFTGEPSDEYKEGEFHSDTHKSNRFYKLAHCDISLRKEEARRKWLIEVLLVDGVTEDARSKTDNPDSYEDYSTLRWGCDASKFSLANKLTQLNVDCFIATVDLAISTSLILSNELRKVSVHAKEPCCCPLKIAKVERLINQRFEAAKTHAFSKKNNELVKMVELIQDDFYTLQKF